MTNREAVKTLKNTAVGNRDGLKWKVLRVSSMSAASDARKRAGIPKESYTSQRRKLVSFQTGMEVRDRVAEIFSLTGVPRERGLPREKMSVGRRRGFDSVGSIMELSGTVASCAMSGVCVCVWRVGGRKA